MGARTLLRYANKSSPVTSPPADWPLASRIPHVPGLANLLVFAHPQCPCTRATLGELELILARVGPVDAYVIFAAPESVSNESEKSDLWNTAVAIPHVHAMIDRGGLEAWRFHATTSGQTMLYNGTGTLLFAGGITASRGHAGPSDGHDSLVALLGGGVMRGASWRTTAPVFGCSLMGEDMP